MKYILVLIVVLSFACSSSQKTAPAGDAKAPETAAPVVAVPDDAAPVKEEVKAPEEKKEVPAVVDKEVPAAIKTEK